MTNVPTLTTNSADWLSALRNKDLPSLNALIDRSPRPLPIVISDNGLTSPLHEAIQDAWLEGFWALLPVSDHRWADAHGDTALMTALLSFVPVPSARTMVKALAPLSDLNRINAQGITPLGKAVGNNDLYLVSLLLKHGANPNQFSQGVPLLVSTWAEGVSPAVHRLLLPRIDATHHDDHDGTLLHALLRETQRHEMPQRMVVERWMGLVQRGANPYRPDGQGHNAWQTLEARTTGADQALLNVLRRATQAWEADVLAQAAQSPPAALSWTEPGTPGSPACPRPRARL